MEDKEYRKECLTCFMSLVYNRMKSLSDILETTEQIGESLSRNDRVSAQILIGNRADEIEELDDIRQEIGSYMDSFSGEIKTEMEGLLEGRSGDIVDAQVEKIIIYKETGDMLLKEIIEKDKIINKRTAGSDSFYQ